MFVNHRFWTSWTTAWASGIGVNPNTSSKFRSRPREQPLVARPRNGHHSADCNVEYATACRSAPAGSTDFAFSSQRPVNARQLTCLRRRLHGTRSPAKLLRERFAQARCQARNRQSMAQVSDVPLPIARLPFDFPRCGQHMADIEVLSWVVSAASNPHHTVGLACCRQKNWRGSDASEGARSERPQWSARFADTTTGCTVA